MLIVSVILALPLIGCGKGTLKTEPVQGTVTLDGVPLSDATVNFNPVSSGAIPGYARTDAQGHYILQTQNGSAQAGTVEGDYIVTFGKTTTISEGTTKNSYGQTIERMRPKETLPDIYLTVKTSPFKVTITQGKNVLDFDLTAKPK